MNITVNINPYFQDAEIDGCAMKVEFAKKDSKFNRGNTLRSRRDNRREGGLRRSSGNLRNRRRGSINGNNEARTRLKLRRPQGGNRGRGSNRGRSNIGRRSNNRSYNN
jgi:hypothetical protein